MATPRVPARTRNLPSRYRTDVEYEDQLEFEFPNDECIKADAQAYAHALHNTTIFEQCALCGVDEALGNATLIENIDIDSCKWYTHLRNKLVTECPVNFANVITEDIDKYGFLRGRKILCKQCARRFRKKKNNMTNRTLHFDDECVEHVSDNGTDDDIEQPLKRRRTTDNNRTVKDGSDYSLVSGLYCGPIPQELQELNFIEISLISRINPICTITMNGKFTEANGKTFCVVNDVTEIASKLPALSHLKRVRVTKNLATQLGVYQGALGTVYGFLFNTSDDLNDQIMWPTDRLPNWKLALSRRQDNVPVILVKLDRLKKDISCEPGISNVVPFCQETHQVPIPVRGKTYYRCQYPLLPAQATTMHKSQGLTASYGGVFQPNKTPTQSHFGLHYVALSRVTTIEKQHMPPHFCNLTLLTYPLQTGHFTSHPQLREHIHSEYDRLRMLPQHETDNISFI
jgi:hypothetical protein